MYWKLKCLNLCLWQGICTFNDFSYKHSLFGSPRAGPLITFAAEEITMKKTALIAIFLTFFCFVNLAWGEIDVQEITKLANNGDLESQFFLGTMYAHGIDVPQNYVEAIWWYMMAADQGHADAQLNLGNIYFQGKGVPQNYAEAMKWYRKAADQGDAKAQFNLGFMYYSGEGVPKNFIEAMGWYGKAADQGFAKAQFNLAGMYYKGEGVQQNFIKAYVWWSLAFENGYEKAKNNLEELRSKMTPKQVAQAQNEAFEL